MPDQDNITEPENPVEQQTENQPLTTADILAALAITNAKLDELVKLQTDRNTQRQHTPAPDPVALGTASKPKTLYDI